MWPRFDSRTRRHMWVKLVVGSPLCSEGFSQGSPVFLPPQKPTFPNSNAVGNSEGHRFVSRKTVKSNPRKTVYLFIYLFIYLVSYLFVCLFVYSFIYLFIYSGARSTRSCEAVVSDSLRVIFAFIPRTKEQKRTLTALSTLAVRKKK